MRFVSFKHHGQVSVGVLHDGSIVDVSAVAPALPRSLKGIILSGIPADLSKRIAAAPAEARMPAEAAELLIPMADPGKVICVGLNYVNHVNEGRASIPDYPVLFMRCTTSLIGPGEPIIRPQCSEKLDYEAELMVIIGRRGKHLPEEEALDYVFGYSCFNEGSVRDYQRLSTQWTPGKNFDRTGPIGPSVVTADELPAGAKGLRIRSILNDSQVLQDANTGDMIFSVAKLIAIISQVMTLEPGDMIATGTPGGVGFARNPPLWLKPGDTITVDIEGVGVLTNPVQGEVMSRPVAAAAS